MRTERFVAAGFIAAILCAACSVEGGANGAVYTDALIVSDPPDAGGNNQPCQGLCSSGTQCVNEKCQPMNGSPDAGTPDAGTVDIAPPVIVLSNGKVTEDVSGIIKYCVEFGANEALASMQFMMLSNTTGTGFNGQLDGTSFDVVIDQTGNPPVAAQCYSGLNPTWDYMLYATAKDMAQNIGFSAVEMIHTPAILPCGGVCGNGTVCFQSQCVPADSCRLPANACSPDYDCIVNTCVAARCPAIACAADFDCTNNTCVAARCPAVPCNADQDCVNNACVNARCPAIACSPDYDCTNNVCVAARCPAVACSAGQVCTNNTCVNVTCPAIPCNAGQDCVSNVCVNMRCPAIPCADGQTCTSGVCTGDCRTSPCVTPGTDCHQQPDSTFACTGPVRQPSGASCAVDGGCLSGLCYKDNTVTGTCIERGSCFGIKYTPPAGAVKCTGYGRNPPAGPPPALVVDLPATPNASNTLGEQSTPVDVCAVVCYDALGTPMQMGKCMGEWLCDGTKHQAWTEDGCANMGTNVPGCTWDRDACRSYTPAATYCAPAP